MFGTHVRTLVVGVVCGFTLPARVASACPCNGDVNSDGIVNILDGVCIMECRNGDCSCCSVSCDINCDGVVDTADIGDDVIVDESTWLCLFEGSSPEVCCPGPPDPDGACCDVATGTCQNNVLEVDCTGTGLTWSMELACTQVSCPAPPDGACCDLSTGTCQGMVLEVDCTGTDLTWSQGLACTQVSCPAPPTGACCNQGNGLCADTVREGDCMGVDFVWTLNGSCAQVSCSVSPQDPCPCNGDVNSDGIVNILDGVCIMECRNGDCSCCSVSCDINCDRVVDTADIGDDVIVDESTWLCLFKGSSPEVCCSSSYQDWLHRQNVPTLGRWGVVILAAIMLSIGALILRRARPSTT